MAKFANVTVQIDGAKIRRTVRRSLMEMGVPLHRADVLPDSCRYSILKRTVCDSSCGQYRPRHRAEESA